MLHRDNTMRKPVSLGILLLMLTWLSYLARGDGTQLISTKRPAHTTKHSAKNLDSVTPEYIRLTKRLDSIPEYQWSTTSTRVPVDPSKSFDVDRFNLRDIGNEHTRLLKRRSTHVRETDSNKLQHRLEMTPTVDPDDKRTAADNQIEGSGEHVLTPRLDNEHLHIRLPDHPQLDVNSELLEDFIMQEIHPLQDIPDHNHLLDSEMTQDSEVHIQDSEMPVLLQDSKMPEHRLEASSSNYEHFRCPPIPALLRPCRCTTVPAVPTVYCGRIRSLKSVHSALRLWFGDAAIPSLRIVDARFEGLPSRAFAAINVTRLQIKDSNLRWIAADAFAGMHSLLSLTLHNVALATFPAESLGPLSSLVSLRLPENHMSEVAREHLGRLGTRLRYLSLAENKLTHLGSRSFPMTLVTLSLAHNCLRGLNRSVRKLVNLEWLFLNDNRFLYLEGELDGLHSLRQLNLARNSLRRLGPHAFRDLDNLQELYLQYNSLGRLGHSVRHLQHLRTLNLAANRIAILEADAFQRLSSLERLDLSGNRLDSLSLALQPLTSLRTLDLSENRLLSLSHHELDSLHQLTLLDLSRNRLHRLEASSNLSLPLERVFLAENRLASLGQFLRQFLELETVDLSHNEIRILNSSDFSMSPKMEYIGLAGNPLLCDEEQLSVLRTLQSLDIELDGVPFCNATIRM